MKITRDKEREAKVVQLRQAGYSNNEIARLLSLTPQRISRIYVRWAKEQSNGQEPAE